MADDRDTQSSREATDAPDSDSSLTDVLSDLFVNAVPIGIISVFVLAFGVLSPFGGQSGDPLVLFHAALIGGVVLVSVVAGWVIRREDAPLRGSAARDGSIQSDDGEARSDTAERVSRSTVDDSTRSDTVDDDPN